MCIMKKLSFLSRLRKEGKIKLVNPSEDVKNAYLKKSRSNLDAAVILLKNNKLEEAISMAYYSMYHIVLALLFKAGIKSENHTASMMLIKKLFGISNEKLIKAKNERVDKQYYVDFELTKKDVKSMIRLAEVFNAEIFDFIEKLTNVEIANARKKLNE